MLAGVAVNVGTAGGVQTFTVTLPLLLVQPPIEQLAVYVFVEAGETDFDVPVPNPSDQVIVPPLHPLAVNVELPPAFIEEGLAVSEGAAGAEHPPPVTHILS